MVLFDNDLQHVMTEYNTHFSSTSLKKLLNNIFH